MQNRTIHLICAARPNFMKIAPLYHELVSVGLADVKIVHSGQHYDINMSDVFFQDLELPEPHIHLGVGGGSHAEQTGKVMIAYEKICLEQRPDLTIVVGDVNSTVACTLAAVKLGIKTAHLEAGLRSYDRRMPEEINRIVTDSIADVLWTPSPDGDENLIKEGVAKEKIVRVGNIMIDSLEMIRPKLDPARMCERFEVESGKFAIGTFHRPSNVDDKESLSLLCDVLATVSESLPLICPLHPRTRSRLEEFGLLPQLETLPKLRLGGPLAYREFISLLSVARLVVTDSGGIQEETTYLKIPCLTARENTERPVTITEGTNKLVAIKDIPLEVAAELEKSQRESRVPDLWDGNTASRVCASVAEILS